ncbi:hypothetical protein Tsubulata_031122 [Turnera subulata]|uniref:SWIM-type domain-containing protein n=1 Tax=Turnera subulata TaxID=218843 RepID=A0A9Q0JM52_9ROSI|nr:hypothetical protein Tsubulata_031122 [Turnera subulata]
MRQVMVRNARRKVYAETLDMFGGNIWAKIKDNGYATLKMRVVFNGDDGWEVTDEIGDTYVVKMEAHSCLCRAWDLTGIPCAHAMCIIRTTRMEVVDYVFHRYQKGIYRNTYSTTIKNGRPQTKRFGEEWEVMKGNKMTRKGRIMHCTLCRARDHRRPKCPELKKVSMPRRRVKVGVNASQQRQSNTNRAPSNVNQAPRNVNQVQSNVNQAPSNVNQGVNASQQSQSKSTGAAPKTVNTNASQQRRRAPTNAIKKASRRSPREYPSPKGNEKVGNIDQQIARRSPRQHGSRNQNVSCDETAIP